MSERPKQPERPEPTPDTVAVLSITAEAEVVRGEPKQEPDKE